MSGDVLPISFAGCAGRLHVADGDVGVVIVPAQGYEQFCMSAGWRELAEDLAVRGWPVLRYDFPGDGDSLGDAMGPDRIGAARASVAQAIDALRAATGVERVVLIGARLGAALALEASVIDGVVAVAALAPVVTGRAYRREITAFAGMTQGEKREDGAILVAGFSVSAQTLAALESIDSTKLAAAPSAVFVAAPDGAFGVDKLVARLDRLGAATKRAPFAGYESFMADPTHFVAPREVFAALTAWLAVVASPTPRGVAITPPPAALDGAMHRDQLVVFDEGRLAGVVTRPTGAARARAVVFLNAGSNAHVGWARQTVTIARELAQQGWASLRFDVAGIGDSARREGRPEQVPYSDESQADLIAALDFLSAQGFADVAVVGPCSGGHLGFYTALRDARIAALVMVNLQLFVWTPGRSLDVAISQVGRSSAHYADRALKLDTWRRALAGDLDLRRIAAQLSRRLTARIAQKMCGLAARASGAPRVESILDKFARLSARGARVLLVYSEGDGGLDELSTYCGPGGRDALRLPGVSLAIVPDADHNLTSPQSHRDFGTILAAFLAAGEGDGDQRKEALILSSAA